MPESTLTEILNQLKTAKSLCLIKDYLVMFDQRYLYIHFAESTTSDTKLALSEYFLTTHKTQNMFVNLDQILRIDLLQSPM